MTLLLRKAQKDMEESQNYKQFFTTMKEVAPFLEVVVDTASIAKLEGTGKYQSKEEPLNFVMFNILRGYLLKGISDEFRDVLKDSMVKEATAEAMKKLTIIFVQKDDQKGYGWELAKVQDLEWSLKVIKNFKGMNFDSEYSSYPSAPEIKDQLLKSL
jgi:hypothetical protein